ncbi:ribonuclease H-like domain-containing protein [Tanacetum coccineum]
MPESDDIPPGGGVVNTRGGSSASEASKLIFGDELYLHPTDASSTPLINLKLTGINNYNVWSHAMTLALNSKNKLGFIDGKCKKPTDKSVVNQWEMCNSVVMGWLLGSISEELYLGQTFSKIPSEVWDEVKETYVKFLMGLDELYLPLRSYILIRDPIPDVKTAFSVICREESYRGSSSATGNKHHAYAFAARSYNEINNKGHNNKKNVKNSNIIWSNLNFGHVKNSNIICSNLNFGLIGHTFDKCYKIVGYPHHIKKKWANQKASSNNASVEVPTSTTTTSPCSAPSLSAEQIHQLLNLLNSSKNSKNAHAHMGGTYICGNTTFRIHKTNKGWIINSGANQHMVTSEEKLENIIDISDLKLQIDHPNGTTTYIKNVRNLRLSDKIILYDVLYVPEYTVNLMSVHKLARDSKLFIGFDEHKCYIQDLQLQKTPGTSIQKEGKISLQHVDPNGIMARHYLINRLPTSVLKVKSPYDIVSLPLKHPLDLSTEDDSEDENHCSTFGETNYNIQNVVNETISQRRSGRTSKLPTKLSDFVLDNKVKCVVTGNNLDEVNKVKEFLKNNFMIKDLGELKYFLGIEVIKTNDGICLSQRKYCLEILSEYGLLAYKPSQTPIESKLIIGGKPINTKDKPLKNITEYQKLLGKLIYLTHTRPDISYAVYSLSQFMHSPLESHLKLGLRILRLSAEAQGDLSSVEAEYRSFCLCKLSEVIWSNNLSVRLKIKSAKPITMYCDNKAAIQISSNPVFHDRTKHFKIDLHFIRDKMIEGIIKPSKIESAKKHC